MGNSSLLQLWVCFCSFDHNVIALYTPKVINEMCEHGYIAATDSDGVDRLLKKQQTKREYN